MIYGKCMVQNAKCPVTILIKEGCQWFESTVQPSLFLNTYVFLESANKRVRSACEGWTSPIHIRQTGDVKIIGYRL